jgi:HAD superfamily hydrolase (TIGR01509 family)
MKPQAVIFDLDGLIADTEIIESRSFIKLLEEHGISPKLGSHGLIHKVGGSNNYFEEFKKEYDINETVENIRDKKRAYYKDIIESEGLEPYPGFLDLIELLKKENFIIALASNRGEPQVHLILEVLKVKHFFQNIIGANEQRRRKPFPDVYLETAKAIGVKPEDCIVLEDADVGIIAAKAAGMKVIGIPNIYTKDHDFSKADILVNSLLEINLDLLKSL